MWAWLTLEGRLCSVLHQPERCDGGWSSPSETVFSSHPCLVNIWLRGASVSLHARICMGPVLPHKMPLASQVEGPEREQGYSRITVYVVRLCGHTVSLPRSFVSQSRQGRPCLMGKGKDVLEEYLGLEIHLGHFLESPVFHSNDPYREQVTSTRLLLLLSFCVLRMEGKANHPVTPGTFC